MNKIQKRKVILTSVLTVIGIPSFFIVFGAIGALVGIYYGAYQDYNYRPPFFFSHLPGYEGWGPFYGLVFGVTGIIILGLLSTWTFRNIFKNKKNVVLFHGYSGKQGSHWMLWLEKELKNKNIPVTFLSYDNSKKPNMDEWQKLFEPIIKDINEETIFVCHSLGCLAAMKLLEQTGKKISKLLLVACLKNNLEGPTLDSLFAKISNDQIKAITGLVEQDHDWDKIKKSATDITFYYSENDYAVPYQETLDYYQPLFPKAEFKSYKNHGHFNHKNDIYEMPDILEKIIKS